MADFKKLADVETVETPADTANVLIEENGVIMKAPKTAVGGATETEYDVVIRITPTYNEEEDNLSATAEFISGSYNDVLQKLDDGIMPTALVIESGTVWDNLEIKSVKGCCPYWCKNQDGTEYLMVFGVDRLYMVAPDGTVLID